ncbi:distal tail protein Dit [Enterococcus casseliflavus]|uniref:distal tail protein Dit n=1 Tax=Enterococcus casseliflavus TaxID=37734 RepID=UPI00115AE688|nr:distal tail protein Dit [Enterococcus casseliflavus]
MTGIFLKVNGFDFSPHFVINAITRPAYSVINEMVNIKIVTGQKNVSTKFDSFLITLDITIAPDLSNSEFGVTEIENLIKEKMLSKTDQQYIFSDRPDRYYLGKLEGESSVVWITETLATMTLSIRVADGLAHALEPKSFPFITTNGDTIATVQNNGTYKTPIDINVTFTSDANSIAFVSAEKVLQLGAAEAPDSIEVVPKTELVLKDQMTSSTSAQWNINQARIRRNESAGDHTSKRMGSLKYDSTGTWVSSTGSVTDEDKFWHGPSISRDIIEMENWEVWSAVTFKSTGGGKSEAAQEGLMEINVLDEDNNFLMGLQLMDGYPTLDKVSWTFFIGDNVVDWGYFPNSVMKSGGGFYGQVIFKKVDNKFSFKIARVSNNKETWRVSRETVNNTIASLSAKRVSYYMATYGKQPAYNMGVSFCQIKKINSLDPLNIPLTFFEGDYLQVINNKIYLNSVLAGDYRVVGGSNVFTVDANITTPIYCVTDGDVTATAEIRERFV